MAISRPLITRTRNYKKCFESLKLMRVFLGTVMPWDASPCTPLFSFFSSSYFFKLLVIQSLAGSCWNGQIGFPLYFILYSSIVLGRCNIALSNLTVFLCVIIKCWPPLYLHYDIVVRWPTKEARKWQPFDDWNYNHFGVTLDCNWRRERVFNLTFPLLWVGDNRATRGRDQLGLILWLFCSIPFGQKIMLCWESLGLEILAAPAN